MRRFNLTAPLALTLFLIGFGQPAVAETRLLMIEEEWCEWCEQWNADIGVIYEKTTEGRQAPLLRADIHEPMPEGISLSIRAQYTPTFVLLDDGREIGRIEGYPGEDFFWGMLNRLLGKAPPAGGS